MGIKLEKVSKTDYKLIENYQRETTTLLVVCKKGLVTDGASIPKFLWGLVGSPFTGGYTDAALLHDGLYKTHKVTKQEADKFFLEVMKQDRVNWLKRYAMHYAVKFLGKKSWKSYSRRRVIKNSKFVEVER